MTEPLRTPKPPPERSPRWAKWLLGCLGACVLLCCGVVSLIGYGFHAGVSFVKEQVDRDAEDRTSADVDRLFREALAEGDIAAVYDLADPRLREQYNRDEFFDIVGRKPTLFTRESLSGRLVSDRSQGDASYRMVRLVLRETGETIEFICRLTPAGRLILVGLVPLLDRAVPEDLKAAFSGDKGHSHRHHHH